MFTMLISYMWQKLRACSYMTLPVKWDIEFYTVYLLDPGGNTVASIPLRTEHPFCWRGCIPYTESLLV